MAEHARLEASSPSWWDALAASAALHGLRLRRGRKLKVAGVAALLVLVAAGGSAVSGDEGASELFGSVLDRGLLSLLAPLLGFLFGAGSFAEEMEEGTFLFQAIRPVPRAALVLGRMAAALTFAGLIWTFAVLGLHVIAHAEDPGALLVAFPSTARAWGGGGLLVLWSVAICSLLGTLLPEAAGVSAGLYLLLVEAGGSWLPGVLRLAIPTHHGRALAGAPSRNLFSALEGPLAERMLPPPVDWYVSLLVLLLLSGAAVASTILVVARSEVHPARS